MRKSGIPRPSLENGDQSNHKVFVMVVNRPRLHHCLSSSQDVNPWTILDEEGATSDEANRGRELPFTLAATTASAPS